MKFDLKSFVPGFLVGVTLVFGLNNLNASNNTTLKSDVIKIYETDSNSSKQYKIQQIVSKMESKEFINVDDFLTEQEQRKAFKESLTLRMEDCSDFANYVSERTPLINTYDLNVLRMYDIAYHKVCKRVE